MVGTGIYELRYHGGIMALEAMPPTDGPNGAPCVLTTTYGRVKPLTRMRAQEEIISGAAPLATVSWDRIVLDEGHAIKNPAALQTTRMKRLRRADGAAAWVLTGTPLQNKLSDLFSLFEFVGVDFTAVHKDERAAALVWRAKALRRTMQDVPRAVRDSMAYPSEDYAVFTHDVVYRSDKEAEFYRAASGTIARQLRDLDDYADRREAAQHRLLLVSFLRMLAVHPQIYVAACNKQRIGAGIGEWPAWAGRVSKQEQVMELVCSWRDAGTSFVLFTHFTAELLFFREALQALGFTVLYIDGSQSAAKRFAVIAQSRVLAARGTQHALLIQIHAGGAGSNIQHISHVIIPSPSWTPSAEAQAIARCHRMGQTERVQVHRFVLAEVNEAAEQIERYILSKQIVKTLLIRRLIVSTPSGTD